MPYRKEQFINREIYHIVIKGIDGNVIFKDIDDHYRGIFSIYEFNNSNTVSITKRHKEISNIKKLFREKLVQAGQDPFLTKSGQERVLTICKN